jgi:DeoR family transcriptional regulator of aga operon
MKATQGTVFRRQEALITYLDRYDYGTVSELAARFRVSEVTIRRDLLFLEKKQLIERYYGGVKRIKKSEKMASKRLGTAAEFPWQRLLPALSPLLREKKLIFVGAGQWSRELIRALADFDLTIVTNDHSAVIDPKAGRALVCLCGGEVESNSTALVGDIATLAFSKYTADLCLIEASGIDPHEITTATLSESFVYRRMFQHTKGEKIIYTEGENIGHARGFMIDRTFMANRLFSNRQLSAIETAQFSAQGLQFSLL